MIVRKYNRETRQYFYFAFYDTEQSDFCYWTTDKADARNLSEDNALKLINYLYINDKVDKVHKVEAISGF